MSYKIVIIVSENSTTNYVVFTQFAISYVEIFNIAYHNNFTFECTALYSAFLLSKGNKSVAIHCCRYTYKCIAAYVVFNIIIVNRYKTVIILKFSFTCNWHLKLFAVVIKSHFDP